MQGVPLRLLAAFGDITMKAPFQAHIFPAAQGLVFLCCQVPFDVPRIQALASLLSYPAILQHHVRAFAFANCFYILSLQIDA